MEPVLEELKKIEGGKVRFGKGELSQAVPRGESLPDDGGLLEEKAKKAVIKMDYALAEKCCRKLREKVSEPAQKEKWQGMEEKLQLFRKITQGTGLSHLVDAKDLARIVIHSPSGDSRQTVRILERRGDLILVQPSYGGEFSVKAEAVREIHPIPMEEWRKEREAELEKRVRDLEKSPPREQMSEYFLLSLFAKTNGFPERGTNFLTKAIAYDEFGWLLAAYFPDERKELLKAWRRATGRASPEPSSARDAREKQVASAPKDGPFPDLKPEEPLPENLEDLLPFAQRHHDQGRFLVGKSLPGMDNAQVNSKLALEHLQLAQDALAKVIESRPNDDKAAKLRRDLAPLIEIAVRGTNFFE